MRHSIVEFKSDTGFTWTMAGQPAKMAFNILISAAQQHEAEIFGKQGNPEDRSAIEALLHSIREIMAKSGRVEVGAIEAKLLRKRLSCFELGRQNFGAVTFAINGSVAGFHA